MLQKGSTHWIDVYAFSVLTVPGWMATNLKPVSGVTSRAQLTVTAADHESSVPRCWMV